MDSAGETIEVLLFGPQAVAAGTDRVTVPAAATVGEVKEQLAAACPSLRPSLPGSRIAVNHEYATDADPVPAGAEVALIGLVSGG